MNTNKTATLLDTNMKTNKKPRVAICRNNKIFDHYGFWTLDWAKYCEENGVQYEFVDCYHPDVIRKLKAFDCLLWHFSGYVLPDMLEAQSILYSAKRMGLNVFPCFESSWHFDDKIAETYYLQTADAPIPDSWMFYKKEDAINWLENIAVYPIVGKLRNGSGSSNVKLLKSSREAKYYVRRMFSKGYKATPSIMLKSKSMMNSSRNWKTVKTRLKKLPQFLHTFSRAKMFPREKGYVFFQKFIPNNGYDLKIVVIGDKLSFIARKTRKDDFRASGGGDLFFDRNLVSQSIIDSAFLVSDKLGFDCMGYDYVVDKTSGKGIIVEISYGFSHTALLEAGGYWDRNGTWHDIPLNAPEEVLYNLLRQCKKEKFI